MESATYVDYTTGQSLVHEFREMILTQEGVSLFPILLVFILSCIIIRKYVKCVDEKSDDWNSEWPPKWNSGAKVLIGYGILGCLVLTGLLLLTPFKYMLSMLV